MSNFNNNNKNAWKISSNLWNISSKPSKNIDESAWNSSPNQRSSSLNPSKNIDRHGKQSSLEKDFVKIIGTRPPISCRVSPIGQNIVIPNTNCFIKKDQTIIGKIVDNTIHNIINHNRRYRTTVNSIVIIEEFNKIFYQNDYDTDKGVVHGMTRSEITTPEKLATPIIPLEKDPYSRKKNRFIFNFLRERN